MKEIDPLSFLCNEWIEFQSTIHPPSPHPGISQKSGEVYLET
jgi:hypothetical protein